MEEDPSPKKGRAGLWVTGTAIAVVAYALSPAPAYLLSEKFFGQGRSDGVLDTVYTPLIALTGICPPVASFYRAYFEWATELVGK